VLSRVCCGQTAGGHHGSGSGSILSLPPLHALGCDSKRGGEERGSREAVERYGSMFFSSELPSAPLYSGGSDGGFEMGYQNPPT
jgi:hypothetical protein